MKNQFLGIKNRLLSMKNRFLSRKMGPQTRPDPPRPRKTLKTDRKPCKEPKNQKFEVGGTRPEAFFNFKKCAPGAPAHVITERTLSCHAPFFDLDWPFFILLRFFMSIR